MQGRLRGQLLLPDVARKPTNYTFPDARRRDVATIFAVGSDRVCRQAECLTCFAGRPSGHRYRSRLSPFANHPARLRFPPSCLRLEDRWRRAYERPFSGHGRGIRRLLGRMVGGDKRGRVNDWCLFSVAHGLVDSSPFTEEGGPELPHRPFSAPKGGWRAILVLL